MDFLMENGELTPDYNNNNIMLFNRDCLEVLKAIPDNSIDLVVSDPPYKLSKRGYGKKKEGKKYCGGMLGVYGNNEDTQYIRDGKLFKHNDITFEEWMPLLYAKLKERRTLLFDDKL